MSTTRRAVLQHLVVGGLATAAVSELAFDVAPETSSGTPSAGTSSGKAGNAPWWLFRPLTAGSRLALGWTLAAVSDVDRGASVVTLAHEDGRVARLHVCAHDGAPRGLASTAMLDLVLMDGGRGDRPTEEDLGRVLLGLAATMRENELAADGDLGPLARMMTHGDRVAEYGPETLIG